MKNGFSERELFMDIINFKSCKRTLKWEMGYLSLTLPRWYKEGLPGRDKSKPIPDTIDLVGQSFILPLVEGKKITLRKSDDVSSYFNLDEGLMGVPVNYGLFPPFEEKLLNEDDTQKEIIDDHGIRKRILKNNSSMPLWLEFPVKNRKDWETIKEERFDLDHINKRYKYVEKFIKEAKNRTVPLVINHLPAGFFGSLRGLMGDDRLLITYYDDPEPIKDMASHLSKLWLNIAEELSPKLDFDIGYFWEDMSYKNGSLISPQMFKEFMAPYYKRLIDFFHSKGINKIMLDTDGYVEKLIPLFLESGINMLYPFERQANNDLIKYRKDYPELVMFGGFDKSTLYKGKEYIEKELDIMKELIKGGGFIPHADHFVPHDVSWENFKFYREKLNKIIDSTEIIL